MSGFDVDSYIQDHASGGGFDLDSYLADHNPAPKQGMLEQAGRATVNALPMIGGVAGGILGTPLDAVTGPAGNMLGAGIGGYLGTAAKNAINQYIDPTNAPQTTTQALMQPVVGGVEQGLMQGAGEAVAPFISRGVQAIGGAAKWASAKALSNALGVNEPIIKEYMGASGRINSAQSVSDLKNISDQFVGNLAADVESGKATVDQANKVLAAHKQDVALKWGDDVAASTQNLSDARADLREAASTRSQAEAQKTFDIKQSLNDANNTLNTEHGKFVQGLKDQSAPTHIAPQAAEAVADLKQQVTDASGKAFDALADSGASMPKRSLMGAIDAQIDGLKIQGKAPVGGQANSAVKSLQELKGQIDGLGDHLSMTDLKQVVQGLDKDINWTDGAGQFMDSASQQKAGIRSSIDKYLKATVPEYKAAMEPLADKARLLSQVSSQYGTPQKAFSRIAGIAGKSPEDQQLLYRLGKETGHDFQGPVERHIQAKDLLSDPAALEQVKQSHPAYEQVQNLEAQLAQRQKPGFTDSQVKQSLQGAPVSEAAEAAMSARDQFTPRARANALADASTTSPESQAVRDAERALDQAQDKLAPFKSLAPNPAGQTSAQELLDKLGKGKNIETQSMFKELGKLTDTDFVQAMHDQGIQAAFKKGAYNGSRNALRFGATGGTIGFFIGGIPGGTVGGTVGANLGGIVDQWGPAVTKKILDGAIKVANKPTIATITQLELPDAVKRGMIVGLENYMAKGGGSNSLPLVAQSNGQANRSPAKGPDAWANSGALKLGLSDDMKSKLMADPKAKQLLIQASDLAPNSQAMKRITDQIQKGWGVK